MRDLAAWQARRLAAWINIVALVGGAVCAVVGAVNLGRDDQSTLEIPFLIGSLLVTAWIPAAGAELLRHPIPAGSDHPH